VTGSTVVIALMRPTLLGTYGDGGNAVVLAQRLRWRGLAAEVVELDGAEPVPAAADLVVLGGGEDAAQVALAGDAPLRRSLHRAVERGAPVLAVCAAFQVLGWRFETGEGEAVEGFGLLDCVTDRGLPDRAVGEVVAESTLPGVGTLSGFENHGGRTRLGPSAQPLGRVTAGVGNGDRGADGGAGAEGAVSGSIVATYLHGPVLARNPRLADYLLERVVGRLAPLSVEDVDRLRAERLTDGRRAS
jgi:CobQ-like glutamine amidotransferase family enzyme